MADVIDINSLDKVNLATTQKQLMVEQAKFEQELAKTDRLMKGRSLAFTLAVEAMKAGAFTGDIDAIIAEAGKVESFLSVGAQEYLALANKLNENDEAMDRVVLAASDAPDTPVA